MIEKDCGSKEPKTAEVRLNKALHRCGHYLHHHDTHPRQAAVLRLLRERGTMSQSNVQEALGIRPGSASELISKLEDRGMLVRARDGADKRKILLSLTSAGLEFDAAQTAEVLAERYGALSGEEQETLIGLLEKLLANWNVGGKEK